MKNTRGLQLMNAEADAAFADLKARMCNDWMVGEDTCAAVPSYLCSACMESREVYGVNCTSHAVEPQSVLLLRPRARSERATVAGG